MSLGEFDFAKCSIYPNLSMPLEVQYLCGAHVSATLVLYSSLLRYTELSLKWFVFYHTFLICVLICLSEVTKIATFTRKRRSNEIRMASFSSRWDCLLPSLPDNGRGDCVRNFQRSPTSTALDRIRCFSAEGRTHCLPVSRLFSRHDILR